MYEAFVPAPDSFSSEGIKKAQAEGGGEGVKVKWLKEIVTGVLDVSLSLFPSRRVRLRDDDLTSCSSVMSRWRLFFSSW